MTSLREEILQDAMGWARFVLSGQATSNGDLIKAYDHDPHAGRPDKPYLQFQITDHENPIGWDEVQRRSNQNVAQFRIRGARWSLLQVDGYGKVATEWLEDVHRSLKRPDVRRWLRSNGPMGVDKDSAIEDTSTLTADSQERRVTASFRVKYDVVSDWFDSNTGIGKHLSLKSGTEIIDPTSLGDLDLSMTIP